MAAPITLRLPRRRRVTIALVAIVVAVAAGVWLAVRDTTPPAPAAGRATVVSADRLVGLARASDHPVFWAGTRPATRLEWTRTADDRTFVRYLEAGARAGDLRAAFLTIASYPDRDPRAAVEAAGRRRGMTSVPTPDGGVATWAAARPTSVYYAAPRATALVEIFSPDARTARSLASSGAVTTIG